MSPTFYGSSSLRSIAGLGLDGLTGPTGSTGPIGITGSRLVGVTATNESITFIFDDQNALQSGSTGFVYGKLEATGPTGDDNIEANITVIGAGSNGIEYFLKLLVLVVRHL